MNKSTLKEFLKGTKNNYTVEISSGNNENIIFCGTYSNLKKQNADLLKETVVSWDVVEMEDESLTIGIMI